MKMQKKKNPFKIFHHYHALSSYHIIHHKNQWKSLKKIVQKEKIWKKFNRYKYCVQVSPMLSNHMMFANMSKSMVIDFLMFASRPSPMEWSLISLCLHQGPLRWNGHWFSYAYIKALSDGMVIVFFLYIKALSVGMVIDFLMFTSRPSLMEWLLIFLCLHQGHLRWNGHWFSYVYIKALSDGMTIDFLMVRPFPMEWTLIYFSHQGPLQWNGHWFLSHLRPSPMEWLSLFLLSISWPSSRNWSSDTFESVITHLFSSWKSGQN